MIEVVASPRAVAGASGELALTAYDGADEADIADPPSPAVSVVNADTGEAFTPAASVVVAGGRLSVALSSAETLTPARLRATWTFTVSGEEQEVTTEHEIVGAVLFTLAEARAFDGGALSNATRFPDVAVLAMRDRIVEAFEEITGRSFGARAKREVLSGDGTGTAWLEVMDALQIVAASTRTGTTWTALTGGELAALLLSSNGRLEWESGVWPLGTRNIRVDLLYGLERVPLEIRRAALWVLRQHLAGTNLPANAISQVDQLGTFQLSIPGRRANTWFGIPEVDEVLARYRRRIPGVA